MKKSFITSGPGSTSFTGSQYKNGNIKQCEKFLIAEVTWGTTIENVFMKQCAPYHMLSNGSLLK